MRFSATKMGAGCRDALSSHTVIHINTSGTLVGLTAAGHGSYAGVVESIGSKQ